MISESIIEQMAANAAALSKGKELSDKKSFSELKRNADSTVFWADCAGSGKKPYKTSIDITDSTKLPVCRCSCPSRQFPCKHAIGLMYEIVKASKFEVDNLPENLAEKIAFKAEKKTNTKAKKPSKKTLEAQQKKIELQLQGLELAKKAIDEIMSAGLGTLTGTSSSKFKELSVELRNYELSSQHVTGLQLIFNRIAFIAEELQSLKSSNKTEEKQRYMAEVLKYLIRANTLIRKGNVFLSSRLSSNLNEGQDFSEDDN
nr:SWIM zinc finger family protein [Treponema sp.]